MTGKECHSSGILLYLIHKDIRKQLYKTIFKVNINQGVPKFLSGILCPAFASTALVGGVGVAMFIAVSCMLVPPPPIR